jgi:hypoxanthine phosphoribosyltransferase
LQKLKTRELVLLPILDGGLVLHNQVARYLEKDRVLDGLELQILPIRARSSHGGDRFKIVDYPDHIKLLQGRAVLVLDDITDTGLTLRSILDYVQNWKPSAVLSFTFLVKKRASTRPDFACFCVPDELLFVGWGMDAGMGAGRAEQAIWDAADYIQHCPRKHKFVDVEMIRFARSVGNSTLAATIGHLIAHGNWHGRPDMPKILAEYFGSQAGTPTAEGGIPGTCPRGTTE